MGECRFARDFVTPERIGFAVRQADAIAAKSHGLSAFDCAEAAVRKVFGRWLLDHAAAVPADRIALYLRLVDDVERRLGLHRRRPHRPGPFAPAAAMGLPPAPETGALAAVA